MAQAIDIDTLKMMMALIKPEPVAPVAAIAPLAPVATQADMLMANNIQYIQKDILEIKGTLKEITMTHVSVQEAAGHIADDNKRHSEEDKILNDHETRLRSIEQSVTRMMTWGTILLAASTLIQVALKLFGK